MYRSYFAFFALHVLEALNSVALLLCTYSNLSTLDGLTRKGSES